MTDNITLRRAVGKRLRDFMRDCDEAEPLPSEERTALAALDAALAEPDATREPATVEQVIAAHGPSWGPSATADFFTGFRAAERFHEIGKEDK